VTVIGRSFAADREFMAIVAVRSNLFYGATELARERHLKAYDLLAELFAQGQRRGEIRNDVEPFQLAEILTATYMLTIANWLIRWWGDTEDLEPRLARAVDVFLGGCQTTNADDSGTTGRARRATSRRKR